MMKKITSLCRRFLYWIRNGFVLSKTVIFIWGLAFSYALVRNAVVEVLIDFLDSDDVGLSEWKATVLTTIMTDLISAVFRIGLTHASYAYTGRFSVIIVSTGAYAMGLMMLNAYAYRLGPLTFALVLIALGKAGQGLILDYFDHQLREEVNKKYATNDSRRRSRSHNLWSSTASFAGSVVTVFGLGITSWSATLQISYNIMVAAYLLFFLGVFIYYPEERPSGSPLTTIYTVIRAAIKKRRLPYPSSEEGYYSNSNNEVSNNVSNDSSCLSFLNKAAIREESSTEACTVEQVKEVKSLYPLIPLGYMLFGYSLVSAAGNTYFVQQTYNLDPKVGHFQVSVVSFFAVKVLFAHGIRIVQSIKELVRPNWSIAVGMFCSVLCGISAWLVERRRLSLTLKDPAKNEISLSIMVLTPQFFLLGLMEAFAEDGLESLVNLQVAKSMKILVDPFSELLLAIEKSCSLLFAYCFGVLTYRSPDKSLLDWYFLFLALLSLGFFVICVCTNSFTIPPKDETQINNEGEASNN